MNNKLVILHNIRETLSDPNRWCQGVLALDITGAKVNPEIDQACRFCLWGAVYKHTYYGGYGTIDFRHNLRKLIIEESDQSKGFETVGQVNDNSTHEEILQLIDRIIKRFE